MKSWKCEKWRLCKSCCSCSAIPFMASRIFPSSFTFPTSWTCAPPGRATSPVWTCVHVQSWCISCPPLPCLVMFDHSSPPSSTSFPGTHIIISRTLSGILRLSPRRSVLTLKVSLHPTQCSPWLTATSQDRFIRLLKNSHIPDRNDVNYNKGIRQRHAAVLGICALVESFPYTVEKWLPELLTGVLAEHTYDPVGPFQKCWIFLNSLNWLH